MATLHFQLSFVCLTPSCTDALLTCYAYTAPKLPRVRTVLTLCLPALSLRRGHFKISRRANAQALAAARAQGFGESKAIGLDKSRMQPVRVVEIEGSPYLGVLGFVEWIMLAFFMLGWCVASDAHDAVCTVCPCTVA